MELKILLFFTVSLLLLSALSAAQTVTDDTVSDETSPAPDYESMTIDELELLYQEHLDEADRIIYYIGLPPEEWPPEWQDKTISDLYMMHDFHVNEAEIIFSHIQMKEEEMASQEPPANDTSSDEDIPPDETPPSETAEPEDNATTTVTANETESITGNVTGEDETGPEMNDTGITTVTDETTLEPTDTSTISADETEQDNMTSEHIDTMRQRMMNLKTEEWLTYNNSSEYREAIGQIYELDVVTKTETETRVEVMVEKISAGNAVRIELEILAAPTDNVTAAPGEPPTEIPVTFLDISVNKEVENIQINVESVDAVPEVIDKPTEVVYEYIEIEKEVLREEDIDDIGIGFMVEKTWLLENEIENHSHVSLFRLVVDEWTELPTRKVSEDDENVYYEALSPGLSYFAIGITAAVAAPIKIEIPEREGVLPDTQDEGRIFTIEFSWVLVLVIISVILIFKYSYITRQIKGLLKKESVDELKKLLEDYKKQKKEALNQYYKREITEQQMNQIVNGIKSKEFDVEMRIKKLQEKKEAKSAPPFPSKAFK
ncbi:MAG: PGF-pre-PGF domain-containing protein [Candidatus Aenigmatarchaeota archaeon]|nr:MAG: PGF-pre-PGF domain-containing protein [Candidatus Aenigmarchaeota archaeon]